MLRRDECEHEHEHEHEKKNTNHNRRSKPFLRSTLPRNRTLPAPDQDAADFTPGSGVNCRTRKFGFSITTVV